MALASFAGAIFVGLLAGNSAVVILVRAMVVMILAWIVGRLVGTLAMHHVQQAIDAYKDAHPIPEDEAESDDDDVIEAVAVADAGQGAQAGSDSNAGQSAGERQAA